MTTYAAPPVTFVRGAGQPALGRHRARVPGLPLRAGGHLPGPCPPGGGRGPLHPGPDPAARLQPVRHRAAAPGGRHPRPPASTPAAGRVFFCNSGAEANECAIKLARRWGGRGRHVVVSAYGSFHGRTLATLHATGQPAKHEPFQPLPEGFRHVAWRRPRRPGRGHRPLRGRGPARAGPGRGRRQPGRRRVLRGGAPALRRAGCAADRRRGPDRPGPHRAVVRLPALRDPARRGDGGQGPRQRRADRGLLGARRRGGRVRARRPRHHLRGPAAGDGRRPGRAGGHGGRRRSRPGAPGPAPT